MTESESCPAYYLDEGTLGKLVDMGLGKGIDSTKSGQRLLDLQVRPCEAILEQLTVRTGYQNYYSEMTSSNSMTKSMSTQLAAKSTAPVQLSVSTEVKQKEDTKVIKIAQGQQIITRTIRFKIGELQRAEVETVPLSTLESLLELQAMEEGVKYSDGEAIPLEKRVEISLDVLVNRNRGATHFVSSVDLGAKLFKTKTKTTKTTSNTSNTTASASGGTPLAQVQSKLHFSDSSLETSGSSSKNFHAIIHPSVQLKQMKTVIPPQHERVINLEISPISQTIRNRFWRESVAEACKQYAEDNMLKVPAMVSTGGPFLITADDYYLKVEGDRVIGARERQDADYFYVDIEEPCIENANTDDSSDEEADPVNNPNAGFCIYYKTPGGQQLFFTADSTSDLVLLVTRTTTLGNAKFFLEFPSTHTTAKLSSWPLAALHVFRKTNRLRRNQYLVLRKEDPVALSNSSGSQVVPRNVTKPGSLVLHAIVGGSTVAAEGQCRCQFAIQNGGLS
jgi:hypothetical protein